MEIVAPPDTDPHRRPAACQRIRDFVKRHRCYDVVPFFGASNRYIEAALPALLVDWAKEAPKLALRITPKCRRKNHHVTLIVLHGLQVLHEEADVLLVLNPVSLGNVAASKLGIFLRFVG